MSSDSDTTMHYFGNRFISLFSSVLTIGLATSIPATPQNAPAPGIYQITSHLSSLAVDVSGASQSSGALIDQAPFSGLNQEWQLLPTGDGYFAIVSMNSGQAIEPQSGSTAAHAHLDQAWHYGPAQEWAISPAGNGFFKIISRSSGLVMELSAPATSAGTVLDQAGDAGTPAQQWALTPVKLPSVRDFGAKGDGQSVSDANVQAQSPTVSSGTAHFTAADTGKSVICVKCAYNGSDAVNLISQISSVSADGHSITLADTPTNAVSGATLYWGTPDLDAFTSMYQSYCNGSISGNVMYVPPAQNSFYMMLSSSGNATWVLDSCGGWDLVGAGSSSQLLGDAGDYEMITVTRSSANSVMSGLQIKNVHTVGINNPDYYWFAVHFDDATEMRILNNIVAGARCALQMDDGGDHIEIAANQFVANNTSGVNANGTTSQLVQFVNVHDNFFTGTVWMDNDGGTGHDVNLEDTGNVQVVHNRFIDNSTTVPGSSAIQASTEEYVGNLSNVLISGNVATLIGNSSQTGNVCMDADSEPGNTTTNYVVSNNTCDGYAMGFGWSGLDSPNQITGVVIKGNWFKNVAGMQSVAGNGGIYFGGLSMAHQGVTIVGDEINGVYNSTLPGGPGITINRLDGVIVEYNYISYMPQQGIALNGVQNSSIISNDVRSNGNQEANTFDGISCMSYSQTCSGNTFTGNTAYDDQAHRAQRYGMYFASDSTGNVVSGTRYPAPGNVSGTILNLGKNTIQP
ncbi:MAG: RICIN domain-containing protein [Acidobacteriaceae bacterium]|nr:RICIN domain-containing protein [Acidobacteriaceae bacterium]